MTESRTTKHDLKINHAGFEHTNIYLFGLPKTVLARAERYRYSCGKPIGDLYKEWTNT